MVFLKALKIFSRALIFLNFYIILRFYCLGLTNSSQKFESWFLTIKLVPRHANAKKNVLHKLLYLTRNRVSSRSSLHVEKGRNNFDWNLEAKSRKLTKNWQIKRVKIVSVRILSFSSKKNQFFIHKCQIEVPKKSH